MRTESIVPNEGQYEGAQGGGAHDADPGDAVRQASPENRPLSHFFGELEIKGLINVSFYAFYCQVEMNAHLG